MQSYRVRYLVSWVFDALAQKCWIVKIVTDPRQARTTAVQEDVLAPRVSVVVTEDKRSAANQLLEILHQTLRVVDGRMSLGARVKPASVEIFGHQGTTMTVSNTPAPQTDSFVIKTENDTSTPRPRRT